MAPIIWKPSYSVGDPAVDHEHRELIELVNTAAARILEGGPDVDVDRSFGDLLRAISAHFAHEERQMRRASYDQLAQHKGDHEQLLDALRDIMDDTRSDASAAADRIVTVLEAWFTEHFRTHDARLHRRLGPHEH
ncbi:MAG TPA: hemerythrin family protein [Hyphomicrobiaceae bacterium]|nr:hemerythrin family protein [Hyphomicrobiaceae bacterium]